MCFGQSKISADLLLLNGKIYTADSANRIFSAMVVSQGKVVALGTDQEMSSRYTSATIIDARGRSVFPGFIDAHSHFIGYAAGLQQADLSGSASLEEVIARMQAWAKEYPGEWLTGRGWDQNLWKEKSFPDRTLLDQAFPDRPVVLIRIDGHSLLANAEAIRRSGIGKEKFHPEEAEMNNGVFTGIFGENAADFMRSRIPEPPSEVMLELLSRAENNCFAVGLTTVNDAGTDKKDILFSDSLQKSGKLRIRMTVMLNPNEENFEYFLKKGIYRTDKITVSAVKIYADGSLGSRSALLKSPYSDDPSKIGILTTPAAKINELCGLARRYGYQVNTHAIGDSAVSLTLSIYGKHLQGKNNLRWRIEHAQVVDPADIGLFRKYSVVPSVQATHATSDMYWAGERVGKERIRRAYAYKDLLDQNGWIPNGTDFPIENIRPLFTFYAAVARKDLKGFPEGGFQKENALSREEALKSITLWAAMASFDEQTRGSLEPGKFADFIILDKDIMTIPEEEIPTVRVEETYSGGKKVFTR